MDKKTKPDVFKIEQILDKTTFIITGENVSLLIEGEILSILAKGPDLKPLNVPVYLIKGTLEVTSVTSAYAIARPPIQTKVEPATYLGALSALSSSQSAKTVRYRPTLDVPADEERGNPSNEKIITGDILVRKADYRNFVDSLIKPIDKKKDS